MQKASGKPISCHYAPTDAIQHMPGRELNGFLAQARERIHRILDGRCHRTCGCRGYTCRMGPYLFMVQLRFTNHTVLDSAYEYGVLHSTWCSSVHRSLSSIFGCKLEALLLEQSLLLRAEFYATLCTPIPQKMRRSLAGYESRPS